MSEEVGAITALDEGAAMSVLDVPMNADENDANASTVGEYLGTLLEKLWREADGFSGKRPFGESNWQFHVGDALAEAGLVEALRVDDAWEYDINYVDKLVIDAIRELFARG